MLILQEEPLTVVRSNEDTQSMERLGVHADSVSEEMHIRVIPLDKILDFLSCNRKILEKGDQIWLQICSASQTRANSPQKENEATMESTTGTAGQAREHEQSAACAGERGTSEKKCHL